MNFFTKCLRLWLWPTTNCLKNLSCILKNSRKITVTWEKIMKIKDKVCISVKKININNFNILIL